MLCKLVVVLILNSALSDASELKDRWQALLEDQPDEKYTLLASLDTTEVDAFLNHLLKDLTVPEVKQMCILILKAPSSPNGSPRLRAISYAKSKLLYLLQTTKQRLDFLKALLVQHHSLADFISQLPLQ